MTGELQVNSADLQRNLITWWDRSSEVPQMTTRAITKICQNKLYPSDLDYQIRNLQEVPWEPRHPTTAAYVRNYCKITYSAVGNATKISYATQHTDNVIAMMKVSPSSVHISSVDTRVGCDESKRASMGNDFDDWHVSLDTYLCTGLLYRNQ
jgi:hypothetical protein